MCDLHRKVFCLLPVWFPALHTSVQCNNRCVRLGHTFLCLTKYLSVIRVVATSWWTLAWWTLSSFVLLSLYSSEFLVQTLIKCGFVIIANRPNCKHFYSLCLLGAGALTGGFHHTDYRSCPTKLFGQQMVYLLDLFVMPPSDGNDRLKTSLVEALQLLHLPLAVEPRPLHLIRVHIWKIIKFLPLFTQIFHYAANKIVQCSVVLAHTLLQNYK